jgi:hypothetical protein
MINLLLLASLCTNPLPPPASQVCVDMEPELQNSVEFGDIDESTMNYILIRCYVNYS